MHPARLIALLTAAISIAAASPAHAGTYTVVACGAASGAANLSWTSNTTTTGLQTANTCTGGGDSDPVANYNYALYARDTFTGGGAGGTLPGYSSAWWRIDAPLGGRITGLRYTRDLEVDQAPAWRAATESDDGELEGCQSSGAGCSVAGGLGYGLDSGDEYVVTHPQDTQWLRFGVKCIQASCPAGGGSIHDVGAIVYSATVTVEENTAPSVSAPSGAIASGASFSTGSVGVTATASDNLGIESLEVLVDGQLEDWADYTCDNRLVRPCTAGGAGRTAQLAIEIDRLSNGQHTTQVRARDGAGNTATGPATAFTVSRQAPPTPTPTPVAPTPVPTTVPNPTATPVAPGPTPAPTQGPVVVVTPGPGPGPTTVPTPAPQRKAKLYAVKTSTSSAGSAKASGRVTKTCASRITLSVAGKTSKGRKKTRTGSTKPRKSGAWSLTVKRPAGVPRKAKLTATLTVKPTALCWAPAAVKTSVRR